MQTIWFFQSNEPFYKKKHIHIELHSSCLKCKRHMLKPPQIFCGDNKWNSESFCKQSARMQIHSTSCSCYFKSGCRMNRTVPSNGTTCQLQNSIRLQLKSTICFSLPSSNLWLRSQVSILHAGILQHRVENSDVAALHNLDTAVPIRGHIWRWAPSLQTYSTFQPLSIVFLVKICCLYFQLWSV